MRYAPLILLAAVASAEPAATDNPEARAALATYDREVEEAAKVYRLAAARAAAKATKALEAAKATETRKGRLEVALAIKAKQETLATVIAEADPAVARRRALLAAAAGRYEQDDKKWYAIEITPDGPRLSDRLYHSTKMAWLDDSTLVFDWSSAPDVVQVVRLAGADTFELTTYLGSTFGPERPKGSVLNTHTLRRMP